VTVTDISPEHAAQLRQRVQGWRAAEVRERQLRALEGSLPPAEALEAALELCELMPENAGSDPIRERETERARLAWRRLRDGWR
jgi:hypothetical protein